MAIANYYNKENEVVKEAFLKEKAQLIVKRLAQYQDFFDVSQIESYEKLKQLVEISKPLIEKQKEAIDLLKACTEKDEQDETFKQIRIALSGTRIPLIDLDSISSGDACFIATAVYMTSNHPDLDTFRAFRDNTLLQTSWGKFAVSIYYKFGPTLALYIGNQPELKNFTRRQLIKLAKWLRKR